MIIVDPIIAAYNINISRNDLGKNYILERCIGMTDKNGVWIYENDILKYDNPFLKNDVVKYQYDDLMSMIGFTLVEPDSEIIGNIHQNKDLLGE